MDDFLEILYSWGNRYLLEGLVTLIFFLVIHFVGYPIIVRRHSKLSQPPTPHAGVSAVGPKITSDVPSIPPTLGGHSNVGNVPKYAPPHPHVSVSPVPAPGGIVQSAPNGIAIAGNNTGSATVNNFGPRPMSISDAQLAAVTRKTLRFRGETIQVCWEVGARETEQFAGRLSEALNSAGLTVIPQTALMLLTDSYRRPEPGLEFTFPEGQPELMTAVAEALAESGFPRPQEGFHAVAVPARPGTQVYTSVIIGQYQPY